MLCDLTLGLHKQPLFVAEWTDLHVAAASGDEPALMAALRANAGALERTTLVNTVF